MSLAEGRHQRFVKALDSALQRHGYSRDKRPDCLQVVVALVLTPDGFPLAYEVLPGNTSDKGTQMAFVRKLEAKYVQIGNLWLMDRGVPTEETLREMSESNYHYLVGAPHGHLKVLGDRLEKAEWVEVQPGIRVKSARVVDENGKEGDLFVLTHSAALFLKETAMRARKLRAAMKTLRALDARIGRSKWRKIEPSKGHLTRDELIARVVVAKFKAGRAWNLIRITLPKEGDFGWRGTIPKRRPRPSHATVKTSISPMARPCTISGRSAFDRCRKFEIRL